MIGIPDDIIKYCNSVISEKIAIVKRFFEKSVPQKRCFAENSFKNAFFSGVAKNTEKIQFQKLRVERLKNYGSMSKNKEVRCIIYCCCKNTIYNFAERYYIIFALKRRKSNGARAQSESPRLKKHAPDYPRRRHGFVRKGAEKSDGKTAEKRRNNRINEILNGISRSALLHNAESAL